MAVAYSLFTEEFKEGGTKKSSVGLGTTTTTSSTYDIQYWWKIKKIRGKCD